MQDFQTKTLDSFPKSTGPILISLQDIWPGKDLLRESKISLNPEEGILQGLIFPDKIYSRTIVFQDLVVDITVRSSTDPGINFRLELESGTVVFLIDTIVARIYMTCKGEKNLLAFESVVAYKSEGINEYEIIIFGEGILHFMMVRECRSFIWDIIYLFS